MSGRQRSQSEPKICKKCNSAFRDSSVLMGGMDIEYCPTCFEDVMGR
jgi:hypothetical protein